tara:strand:+ start:2992 stop:3942 length:951 start_codon:yes stop_codon:yes gene_type:complete
MINHSLLSRALLVFTSLTLLMLSQFVLSSPALCQKQGVDLQVLGSGGPELDDGRASSSYVIWHNKRSRLLVDIGPGSSVNFGRAGADFNELDGILLTHLHVDHSSDLPAYVKGAYFNSRTRVLPIYGPDANALMPSTSDFVQRLFAQGGVYPYLADYLVPSNTEFYLQAFNVTNSPEQPKQILTYSLAPDLSISAIAVHHGPVAAVAWRVDIAGCIVSFSGDMNNQTQHLRQLAQDADLLVINNAITEQAQGAARNLHMPPSEIGKIAQAAKVKRILLTHFMKRTNDSQTETIRLIKQFYAGKVDLSEDMLRYPLP